MAQLQMVPFGRTARVPRRPQHTFTLVARPWQLVPCMIAPVLPGETMKNMLFQARVVTDPIANPLIGWWCEFWFFYCRHRDLAEPERTTAINMMIDPGVTMPLGAASLPQYAHANSFNWLSYFMNVIVGSYFRDEGEALNAGIIGNYYASQVSQRTVLDSALLESEYVAGAPGLVVGADDTITGQEMSNTYMLWQMYRMNNITNLTYDEYLATYGIPVPAGAESSRRPELIRYVKEWSYPVNTVDPTTGTPSSAVSWAVAERADKDRFFREPGFIIGVVCVRPKAYLKNQAGTVTGDLTNALSWLPAVLGDNPEYSVRKFTGGTGPFAVVTTDYRVDLKDLFLYGEQFTNTDLNTAKVNPVALPTLSMQKKYPASADADACFKTPTANSVRMDGVVSLNILGMQVDTTPTQSPTGF